MTNSNFTDEKLNMFIDEQLDTDDREAIQQALLNDESLRKRVCQLKSVRELVEYAYQGLNVPATNNSNQHYSIQASCKGIAASLLLMVGVIVGWVVHDGYQKSLPVTSSADVFQYYKDTYSVSNDTRKIILHVTTGDIYAVNEALKEAEQLLVSYRDAGTPMKLDIITYKEGINMLRVGVSPYIRRLEEIINSNENVTIYACQRSVSKAKNKDGGNVVLMPQVVTDKTALELISERIKKGWIYIKV